MRTLFPRRYAKNAASLRRPPQEPPRLPAPRVPRALPQLPRPLRPPRRRALLDPSLLPSRVREQRRIACRDFAPLENMPLLCFRSGSGGSFLRPSVEVAFPCRKDARRCGLGSAGGCLNASTRFFSSLFFCLPARLLAVSTRLRAPISVPLAASICKACTAPYFHAPGKNRREYSEASRSRGG